MKRKGNFFKSVSVSKPPSSTFDLSHDVKQSFKMGRLVPFMLVETLPGDSFKFSSEFFTRMMPLVAPVMHRLRLKAEFFFVPTRIIWENFEHWITGDLDVEAPYVPVGPGHTRNFLKGTIFDYLGYPIYSPGQQLSEEMRLSPIPLAAYAKVYNEYYRDQNLVSPIVDKLTDGNNLGLGKILREGPTAGVAFNYASEPLLRAWERDYFTSALPFPQKGPDVSIPLGTGDIPVHLNIQQGDAPRWRRDDLSTPQGSPVVSGDIGTDGLGTSIDISTSEPAYYDPNGTLRVDMTTEATSIETLRRAFRLKEWLERNARAGTRYVESILAHFGIKSSDARLQRPEFIGSVRGNVVISEVLATAQDLDNSTPIGQMAGHGVSYQSGSNLAYRCEEHGYIIGIMSVVPDTAYQDGVPRHLFRFDRLDYAWPTFANVGEQELYNKEVYQYSIAPEDTFGYVPRYAEYKFLNSRVAGDFRDTLAFWHLGRKFGSEPVLSREFIECVPSNRIFAIVDEEQDHLLAHILNHISVKRKLPYYGTPTI